MQELDLSPNNFEQCLKCNLCTSVCPMMAANPHYPGPKQAGPDGERYRLKDPRFYDLTLRYCLNCKRCEVACPSGVKVGDIIQNARIRYGKQHNPVRDFTLASTDLVGSLASPFAPVVNAVLGWEPVKAVMHGVIGVDKHRTFPAYSKERFSRWFRREAAALQAQFPRKVAYFHGCYVEYNYPQLGKDFVRLMNAAGYGVELLEGEKCCGVALISNGFAAQARRQAEGNLAAMRKALAGGAEAILTTSSTCTFTMRDEYEHILGLDNSNVRPHLQLATRWLYDKMEKGEVRLEFREDCKLKVSYHTACHMAKLGWSIFSTGLLRMIPGMELDVLPSECCGIAGTFGFKKENYPYSQKIGETLFGLIRESGPQVVATDCETCKWQIEMSTGYPVKNPVSILAEALE
ncbi:MAG: anaerobic glycerol-3-phosphate dehydrogenase subunit C [Bacteroidales bacterium]|nr:anaerobic glycerol-3-phosphate dehydrogenase subunit C [Bacteroidales bacterium]